MNKKNTSPAGKTLPGRSNSKYIGEKPSVIMLWYFNLTSSETKTVLD